VSDEVAAFVMGLGVAGNVRAGSFQAVVHDPVGVGRRPVSEGHRVDDEPPVATGVAAYFCDPHSPWQRGSNENTNGLRRQYFPKGHDLSGYTQADLNAIADKLNTRPRKTLNYATPADTLADHLATTT
jgi:hypothetical protein